MGSKTIRAARLIAAIMLLVLAAGLTACAPKSPATVTGPYDTSGLAATVSYTGAYAVGSNAQELPIFEDTDKAFEQALIDYAEGFKAIQDEFNVAPISLTNYKIYKTYGWQLSADDEEVIRQGHAISAFFDIYENSFGFNTKALANATCRLSACKETFKE